MQVTRTKCTNNRKHFWKTISKEYKADGKVYYIYAWCCQCGSLTEFVGDGIIERVIDRDNEYLIIKPEIVG